MSKKSHNPLKCVAPAKNKPWHNALEHFGSCNANNPNDPGTLDDAVDIQEPDYDDSKAREIEAKLAQKDGLPPIENELEEEKDTFTIEEPNVPDPY